MRKNELELIAALAEGRLADESEARALIESSARLRKEFEAQRAAIEALRGMEPVSLTEVERAALRRDLWTELRASGSEIVPTRRRLAGWPAYVTALALIVGSLAVLGPQLSQTDIAAAPTFDETSQALSADGAEEDMAPSEGATATAQASPERLLGRDELAAYRTLAEAIRSGETADFTGSDRAMYSSTEATTCISDAGLEAHHFLGQFEVTEWSTVVAASPVENPTDGTPISFIDPESCEVIFVVE